FFVPDYSDEKVTPLRNRLTHPPGTRFQFSSGDDRTTRRLRVAVHHSSDDRCVARVEFVLPGHKASRHGWRAFIAEMVTTIEVGQGLLIVDVWPPTPRDPQGVHGAIWQELDESQPYLLPVERPLTLASYVRDPERTA